MELGPQKPACQPAPARIFLARNGPSPHLSGPHLARARKIPARIHPYYQPQKSETENGFSAGFLFPGTISESACSNLATSIEKTFFKKGSVRSGVLYVVHTVLRTFRRCSTTPVFICLYRYC